MQAQHAQSQAPTHGLKAKRRTIRLVRSEGTKYLVKGKTNINNNKQINNLGSHK